MTRECHVRFCERLGVRLPGATLPPCAGINRHDRVVEVGAWLRKVVWGYYQYHAVPGNIDQLSTFKHRIHRLWRNVLVRRSQTARKKWTKYGPVFDRWIPTPRILHPYPEARFYATHPS
jgi:RNA-directed DNA polymerase